MSGFLLNPYAYGGADLYTFTNATFTSGGVSGRTGPALAQAIQGLSGTNVDAWKNNPAYFDVLNGFLLWTVPATGNYAITVAGAIGGQTSTSRPGGQGAKLIISSYPLLKGTQLKILVGQTGLITGDSGGSGGGGASMIYNNSTDQLIAVAGGGGGGGTSIRGISCVDSSNGGAGTDFSGTAFANNGGTNGSGGNLNTGDIMGTCAWGGAGYTGDGPASSQCGRSGGSAAIRLSSTAIGGLGEFGTGAGGFGGGGGGANSNGYGGGGGGYSGGGSGGYSGGGGGGGGGSLVVGASYTFQNNNSSGFVSVEKL